MGNQTRFFSVLLLIILVAFLGCNDDNRTGPSNPEVANEAWEVDIDNGEGEGQWTLVMFSDSIVTSSGEFLTSFDGNGIVCPFTSGPAVIAGSSLSFTSHGTATFASDPSITSPFTLTVDGTTTTGQGDGVYVITFSAEYWPPMVSGNWTATRSAGGGITE